MTYVSNHDFTFSEVFRVLKPGGRFVINDVAALDAYDRDDEHKRTLIQHTRELTVFGGFWYYKYWEDAYRAAGFELISSVGRPAVEVIKVGRYRWQQLESNLAVASDVEETLRKLEQIGADDVVQLRLSGVCDLVGQRQLDSGVEAARARSRAMLLDAQDLSLEPTQADIEAIHADGYVGEVLQQLRAEQSEAQRSHPQNDPLSPTVNARPNFPW